ncbi:MAG: hypothetical protein ABIG67_08345 [Pseudomonadota bacterium]
MSRRRVKDKTMPLLSYEDQDLFEKAWETRRSNHGNDITFYLPGMIRYGRERGRYPAVSITGDKCELLCQHCKGRLLEPMIKVSGPDDLVEKCHQLSRSGSLGVLLSGGSDLTGRLPWERYYPAIKEVKERTSLFLSAHIGFPDQETCIRLRNAGVEQALIDVMGDEETATRIYHLDRLNRVLEALDNISKSNLQLVPHIVAGLFYGQIRGEWKALEIIREYKPSGLVIVVITPLKGTPMADIKPPDPIEVGRLIAHARIMMPRTPISLGCERPRNRAGRLLEQLALLAGINRMAVWSEEALKEARALGLQPRFQATCCSLPFRPEFTL